MADRDTVHVKICCEPTVSNSLVCSPQPFRQDAQGLSAARMADPRRDAGCTARPPPRSTNVHAANLARYNLAGACREGYSLANGGRALRMSPARTASQRTLSCGPARRMDRRRDVDLPPEGHLSSARGERWPTARVISPADPHGRVCWDGHSQGASGRGVSLPVVENPTPRQPPRPPRSQGGSTCVTAASSATGRGARPPMASLRGRHPSTIQLANGVL